MLFYGHHQDEVNKSIIISQFLYEKDENHGVNHWEILDAENQNYQNSYHWMRTVETQNSVIQPLTPIFH